MTKKSDDILKNLERAVAATKQMTLAGTNFNEVNALCVEWLQDQGYSVHAPLNRTAKPKVLDDLFNTFYSLFREHYPDLVVPYNGTAHDRKIAKDFVQSRMDYGNINKQTAMAECIEIIEGLFRFKDQLNLDKTPTFGIFTPSMGWLTGKIIDCMNKNKEKIALKRIENKIEEQTRLIESSFAPEELREI